MAKLTGKAALEYIQRNPNAKYKVTQGDISQAMESLGIPIQMPQAPQKKGIIGSIVDGITKPFRNLAGSGVETGYDAIRTGTGFLKDIMGIEQDDDWMFSRDKGIVMGDDQFNKFKYDPLGEGLKTSAGIVSYAVPGGKGVQGLKRAAVAGGLGGFSVSDLDDPMDVLKNVGAGAGFGVATQGAFELGGKAINKVRGMNLGSGSTKGFSKEAKSILKEADNFYKANPQLKSNNDPISYTLDYLTSFSNKKATRAAYNSDKMAQFLSGIPDERIPQGIQSTYGISDDAVKAAGSTANKGFADKLNQAADNAELYGVKKAFGNKIPKKSDGGAAFLKELIDDPKFNTSGVLDDLLQSSDEILTREGKLIKQATRELSESGAVVDITDVMDELQKKIDKNKVVELKRPIEEALESLQKSTKGQTVISLDDVLELKQGYGKLGKWNQFTPSNEVSKAKAYETLYKSLNSKLDDGLKNAGFNEFRDINKSLNNAIKARNFAEEAIAAQRGAAPINLVDVSSVMAGGAITGDPTAGVATAIVRRAVDSPKGSQVIANTLRKVADITPSGKFPQINLSNLGQNKVVQEALRLAPLAGAYAGIDSRIPSPVSAAGAEEVVDPVTGEQTIQEDEQMSEVLAVRDALAFELMNTPKPGGRTSYSYNEAMQRANMQIRMQTGVDVEAMAGGSGEEPGYSERKALAQAQFGLTGLEQIEGILFDSPSVMYKGLLPNILRGSDARQYKNAVESAAESFGRMQSGGAINKEEEARFKDMLPKPFDDPETARIKLNNLRVMFEMYGGSALKGGSPTYSSPSEEIMLADALAEY